MPRVVAGRPAVFLDRDGVLNEVRMAGATASTPRSVDELHILPTAGRDLERLRAAGFVLLVVSNQPDVARGDLSVGAVDRINSALREALPIDAVYYCPHDTTDACSCRKPKPGLIRAGQQDWGIDLGRSCLVGDRWVDLGAAAAAGIDGILVSRPWSWDPTSIGGPPDGLAPRFAANTLEACVDFILGSDDYGVVGNDFMAR